MTPTTIDPRRGEIGSVDFDPSVGEERCKRQPARVRSPPELGRLALHIVVPFTDRKQHHEVAVWLVPIHPGDGNGRTKLSSADGFQVKSLSPERFNKGLGVVSSDELE